MTSFELYLREIILRRDEVPDFGRYPFVLPAVATLERLRFRQPVTFLIGENGSGKSTLLEAMAVLLRYNPEGGSRNFRFGTRESRARGGVVDKDRREIYDDECGAPRAHGLQ